MNFIKSHSRRLTSIHTLSILALAAAFSVMAQHQAGAADSIVIGTGGKSGVYYPTGKAICNALKKREDKHGITCSAVSTKGSVANIELVRTGKAQFGIVQSDVQFYGLKGYGPFRGKGPFNELRSVLSFYAETFTVVARADAGIRTSDDLKGKRVNIGNPGSGQRTSMELMMHAKGWSKSDFALTLELPSSKQSEALCNNEIDAFVFTAGHPNDSIKQAANACDTRLISVGGRAIQQLIKKYPYFGPVRIPGGTYPGTGASTTSFGVTATLVTSADTPPNVVYEVVKSIFEDFVDFRFAHAALSNLKPEEMVSEGQIAPHHPGAIRYFEKMGYSPRAPRVPPPRGR